MQRETSSAVASPILVDPLRDSSLVIQCNYERKNQTRNEDLPTVDRPEAGAELSDVVQHPVHTHVVQLEGGQAGQLGEGVMLVGVILLLLSVTWASTVFRSEMRPRWKKKLWPSARVWRRGQLLPRRPYTRRMIDLSPADLLTK